jgi:hypothetical protein
MTKRYVFTAPEALKDATVIAGHPFVDGQYERNEFDGPLVAAILCGYYACNVAIVDDSPVEDKTPANTSLAKSNTSASAAATKASAAASEPTSKASTTEPVSKAATDVAKA